MELIASAVLQWWFSLCLWLLQMLGPVIAPFIGAALTQSLGWRSMMWFLAILSGAAQLAVVVIYRSVTSSPTGDGICSAPMLSSSQHSVTHLWSLFMHVWDLVPVSTACICLQPVVPAGQFSTEGCSCIANV
jgi:MFS family permease